MSQNTEMVKGTKKQHYSGVEKMVSVGKKDGGVLSTKRNANVDTYFPKRLKEVIDDSTHTNASLARSLKISRSHVTNLLSSAAQPSNALLNQLAFGEGEKFLPDSVRNYLTKENRDLVSEWSKLPKAVRSSIYNMIKAMVRECDARDAIAAQQKSEKVKS